MSPTQIVALAVRIFVLAVAFSLFTSFVNSIMFLLNYDSLLVLLAGAVFTVFIAAALVALWRNPVFVAEKILPVTSQIEDTNQWSNNELYVCGFVLLGTYLLFQSVADSLYWGVYLVKLSRDDLGMMNHTYREIIYMVMTFAKVIASIAIIIGAQGITKLIYKIRFGGIK